MLALPDVNPVITPLKENGVGVPQLQLMLPKIIEVVSAEVVPVADKAKAELLPRP